MMRLYRDNIILLVGSGIKEFPLSCFSLQNSSLKGFCEYVHSGTLCSATYVSVWSVERIDVTRSSHDYYCYVLSPVKGGRFYSTVLCT